MPPIEVSPLVLALVGGGFTILGIVLKIGYDAVAAKWAAQRSDRDRFANDRKETYERFLRDAQEMRAYHAALRRLVLQHREEGRTSISEEEQAAFPASPRPALTASLEQVQRLAGRFEVIRSAEAIYQLFSDMTRASRASLEHPGNDDEVTWFVLQRFLEDRIREFVHGYRRDVGLGKPVGAPKRYPIIEREWPVPLDQSEQILRAAINARQASEGGPSAGPAAKRGNAPLI